MKCSIKRSKAAFTVLVLASLLLGGCANNTDVRAGHDYTSGMTAKNPPQYLGCVQGELQGGAKTYLLQSNGTVELFVDSTDPRKASGMVEMQQVDGQYKFLAYQRDAWYDKGRLLDAALMCSRA
ncbi:hypothetical protein JYG34_15190 [Pseudomonas entomophila]|uniref:hypothetical protein n=1 Tax=Pseudomonas entomophila TaxID=312306 RepID=UPI001BCCB23F|nr:hypothetical protein [Pseudomonas entomophila]QVM89376.1 hypothetical protein JYG34_15190 [Pseudomonas entomophila]